LAFGCRQSAAAADEKPATTSAAVAAVPIAPAT
jgi:hypothetical protein